MHKYKMELSSSAFAFKLLDTACSGLTFASMKFVLKWLFGAKPAAATSTGINQETGYITDKT